MEEHIEVDTEALAQDIERRAKEKGLIVKAFCPDITPEKILTKDEAGIMPVVNIEGWAGEMTVAMMCISLESTIEKLKERDGVNEAIMFLKLIISQKTVDIERKKENND